MKIQESLLVDQIPKLPVRNPNIPLKRDANHLKEVNLQSKLFVDVRHKLLSDSGHAGSVERDGQRALQQRQMQSSQYGDQVFAQIREAAWNSSALARGSGESSASFPDQGEVSRNAVRSVLDELTSLEAEALMRRTIDTDAYDAKRKAPIELSGRLTSTENEIKQLNQQLLRIVSADHELFLEVQHHQW